MRSAGGDRSTGTSTTTKTIGRLRPFAPVNRGHGTNAKGDSFTNGNEAIPFGEPLTGRRVPTASAALMIEAAARVATVTFRSWRPTKAASEIQAARSTGSFFGVSEKTLALTGPQSIQ